MLNLSRFNRRHRSNIHFSSIFIFCSGPSNTNRTSWTENKPLHNPSFGPSVVYRVHRFLVNLSIHYIYILCPASKAWKNKARNDQMWVRIKYGNKSFRVAFQFMARCIWLHIYSVPCKREVHDGRKCIGVL